MVHLSFIPYLGTLLISLFTIGSATPTHLMASSPNVNDLQPRATTKSATCYIFGQRTVIGGNLRLSHLVEIAFSGSWPDPAGLKSALNTNLGSENVVNFVWTATSVEFYAPAEDSAGTMAIHWDSQISNSIYSFSGNTIRPTIKYPAV